MKLWKFVEFLLKILENANFLKIIPGRCWIIKINGDPTGTGGSKIIWKIKFNPNLDNFEIFNSIWTISGSTNEWLFWNIERFYSFQLWKAIQNYCCFAKIAKQSTKFIIFQIKQWHTEFWQIPSSCINICTNVDSCYSFTLLYLLWFLNISRAKAAFPNWK